MPSFMLNNITAPDNYTATSTLQNLGLLDHINIDVANQAIYWSLQQSSDLTTDLAGAWQPEIYMAPGSRSLYRAGAIGIRIRAAIPAASLPTGATAAQATVEAIVS